ncbi:hypothetical protein BKA70DRAFT_541225 [Coprinopsis sp. MPI-PUGE-AT-0042]|nr:hypothetical protein BKA70DRAFT_541225 [Coprinopsis sp. MPI-PUGE-AT-0042]
MCTLPQSLVNPPRIASPALLLNHQPSVWSAFHPYFTPLAGSILVEERSVKRPTLLFVPFHEFLCESRLPLTTTTRLILVPSFISPRFEKEHSTNLEFTILVHRAHGPRFIHWPIISEQDDATGRRFLPRNLREEPKLEQHTLVVWPALL